MRVVQCVFIGDAPACVQCYKKTDTAIIVKGNLFKGKSVHAAGDYEGTDRKPSFRQHDK